MQTVRFGENEPVIVIDALAESILPVVCRVDERGVDTRAFRCSVGVHIVCGGVDDASHVPTTDSCKTVRQFVHFTTSRHHCGRLGQQHARFE